MPLFFDPTYILVIIAFLITLISQLYVKSTFEKYSKLPSSRGYTGFDAASQVLRGGGVSSVSVRPIRGNLNDHYDPRTDTINLSDPVYGKSSAAAIGVAAHEAGHALQHADRYFPIKVRTAIIPLCNFSSSLAWPLFIIGIFLSAWGNENPFGVFMMYAGIALFSVAVLFQLITLPVEFNASRRAMVALRSTGLYTEAELDGARRVLTAAALTYVAALASSMLQILRLLLIAQNRRR